MFSVFFFQAEDGIRDVERSRGLGDVYKRQILTTGVSNLAAWQLTNSACRPVKGVEPARGTFYHNCPGSSQSGAVGSADNIVG